MTAEEWLAATLADAPPLSQAQIAILRPVFRPVIPQITNAAPARQQEPPVPAMTAPPEGSLNSDPS